MGPLFSFLPAPSPCARKTQTRVTCEQANGDSPPPHRKNTDRGRRQRHDFPGIPRARKNTQELRPQPTLRQHKKTSPEDGTLPKTASSIPQRGAPEKRLPSSFPLKQTASCLRPFSSPKTPPAFRAGAPLARSSVPHHDGLFLAGATLRAVFCFFRRTQENIDILFDIKLKKEKSSPPFRNLFSRRSYG